MALTPQVLVGVTTPADDITELIDDLQWSSTSPGGFASCSFTIPGGGLVKRQNLLREGNKVWVRDGDKSLWEGVIVNHPHPGTFGDSDEALVECGGLLSIAKNRDDYAKTWTDSDYTVWFPGKQNSQWYTFDQESRLYICAEQREADDGAIPSGMGFTWRYWVDSGLGGDDIDHLEFDADYDLGSNFTCKVQTSTNPWGTWADNDGLGGSDWWSKTDLDQTLTTQRAPASGSFPAGTRAVRFYFLTHSSAAVSADRFMNITGLSVLTAASSVTLDTAMVAVANDTGLATTTTNTTIGSARLDLVIRPFNTRAAALEEIAALHSAPVDYGFWDNATFSVAARATTPALMDHLIVQASDPGMTWDVTKRAEGAADYVCVLYGASGVSPYPTGTVLAEYRPSTPATDADVRVSVLDMSDTILTQTLAQAVGDQYLDWTATNEYEGLVTVTGSVTRVDGAPLPAAWVRAGMWVECPDIIGHEPLYITQVEYDAQTETATLTIGESFEYQSHYYFDTDRPHFARPREPMRPR
jgi:hypothetical protein